MSHPISVNALLPYVALCRPISGRFTIYSFIALSHMQNACIIIYPF
jgi:hypothetical protein